MTWLFVIIALVISTSAFFYLAHINSKRRRAFKLPDYAGTPLPRMAVFVLVLPGLFFIAVSSWSAFVVWAAGITVIGWVIAATSPVWLYAVTDQAQERLSLAGSALMQKLAKIDIQLPKMPSTAKEPEPQDPSALEVANARIDALEARIIELEGEVINLKAKPKPRTPRKRAVKRPNGATEPETSQVDA